MESRGMRGEDRMKYCTYKSIQGDEYMSTSFIEQVHYNRIPVKDLELSANWYRDILGLQLLSLNEELAILKINEGPSLLILVPTRDETYAHFTIDQEQAFSIAFTSPDIPGFHQHLTDHQVKVDNIQHDEDHAYFLFHDPDGNKFQVHW
jgi:catechol-2,3-dioxygenase